MKTLAVNHSSYPRIGEKAERQRLRWAVDRWERKEIDDAALEKVIRDTIAETVAEQEGAGIDLVTDGQIRWFDPISHWLRRFKGVKAGRLTRLFDTNRYFRVPRIERLLEPKEDSLLPRDLATVLGASKKPVKAILVGPITLAGLSDAGGHWKKKEDLIEHLADRISEEVAGLSATGAAWIQIEEPIVLKKTELFPLLAPTLKKISEKKGRSKILLTTYFGDAAPFYERLQKLTIDGLGLDCLYGPDLLAKVAKEGSDKVLSLGLVDGRSTRLELVTELTRRLKPVRRTLGDREIHLTSSCGLDYLPRTVALEKLRLLVKLKERIS